VFKVLWIHGTWGVRNRLPMVRGERGPVHETDAEGGVLQPEGLGTRLQSVDGAVTVTHL